MTESFSSYERMVDTALTFMELGDPSVRGVISPSELGEPLMMTEQLFLDTKDKYREATGKAWDDLSLKELPRLWQSSMLLGPEESSGIEMSLTRVRMIGIREKTGFINKRMLDRFYLCRPVAEVVLTDFSRGGMFKQRREFFDEDKKALIIRGSEIAMKVVHRGGQTITAYAQLCGLREKDSIGFASPLGKMYAWLMPRIWTVSIGYEGTCRILFPTDPVGVLALFKDRDKPSTGGRRNALMHWVSEHWRQNRCDAETETYVRTHLRGTTDFSWNGMMCRVKPSDEAIQLVEEGKEKRKNVETPRAKAEA